VVRMRARHLAAILAAGWLAAAVSDIKVEPTTRWDPGPFYVSRCKGMHQIPRLDKYWEPDGCYVHISDR